MKRVSVIIMILFAQYLAGQNYQNICTPGVTFFKSGIDGKLHAFRPDSLVAQSGQDTLFISYMAIRYSGGPCLDTTNGSVFGKKVLHRFVQGQFMFFNHSGDTIIIQTQAGLNHSWTMMHLQSGNYLEAKVTGIATESFVGVSDQVKTISCQAKNSTGGNISHPFNYCVIKLSQHYGLVGFFDVFSSPETLEPVTLSGKQSPAIGVQYASATSLFDFEIGDEFHYSGFIKNYILTGGLTEWTEIKTIIGKTLYIDSAVYISERCRRETRTENPFYISIHDTVIDKYIFTDPFYSSLPDEFLHNQSVWYGIPSCEALDGFNGRNVKVLWPWAIAGGPNCWTFGGDGDLYTENYTDGLGKTYFHHKMTVQMYTEEQNELVYFHKGNEIWGTPVATDCNTLVGLEHQATSSLTHLGIAPNPAKSYLTIDLAIESVLIRELKIYDILGKQMAVIAISPLENQINLNVFSWPRGVYVIKIDDIKNGTMTKLFVLN